jgi:acyl-CoA dehydrogenase
VVAKTDPAADPPHKGISLLLVEADTPGFVRGKRLDKLGLRGQDTSEIFFQDCPLGGGNRLFFVFRVAPGNPLGAAASLSC